MYDRIQNYDEPFTNSRSKSTADSLQQPYLTFERWQDVTRFKTTPFGQCIDTSRDFTSGLWAFLILMREIDICDSIKLHGFMGHLYPFDSYHYDDVAVNSTEPSEDRYNSRLNHIKGGHDFKREQLCLMQFADHVSVENDEILYDSTWRHVTFF